MPHDRLIHIHRLPGDPCIACGDADIIDTDFITDTGDWNQERRNCSPSAIVSPEYVLTGRADPRTSALKGERKPPRKKEPDPR